STSAPSACSRALRARCRRSRGCIFRLRRARRTPMTEDPPIPANLLKSLSGGWMNLRDEDRPEFLASLPPKQRDRWLGIWQAFALPHQREPLLTQGGAPWTTWLILGGRGAGKTRAGAEWVRAQALDPKARIALIGETERDVREV